MALFLRQMDTEAHFKSQKEDPKLPWMDEQTISGFSESTKTKEALSTFLEKSKKRPNSKKKTSWTVVPIVKRKKSHSASSHSQKAALFSWGRASSSNPQMTPSNSKKNSTSRIWISTTSLQRTTSRITPTTNTRKCCSSSKTRNKAQRNLYCLELEKLPRSLKTSLFERNGQELLKCLPLLLLEVAVGFELGFYSMASSMDSRRHTALCKSEKGLPGLCKGG